MKSNLDIVDELFNSLKKLQPLKAEDKNRLERKFRLEFNYNSNHIEGNTLTYGETELLLIHDDTKGNHSMREYEETKAHDVAYHTIERLSKDSERPLNEQIIKELNEIILVRPYWKDAITPDGQNTRREIKVGGYKEFPNSVRLQNGEIFEYVSPSETPVLMQELVEWFRSEENAVHPVTLAAMLHYKFVRIHPFDDGNGRISRLLMNYVLLKNEYPPVIIKSSDKQNYLRVLHLADTGDYEPLINYIIEQTIWSLNISIKAAKGESLEEADDFVKEIELLKRKASSKPVPKSPQIIYDTFKLLQNKIWEAMLSILEHSDSIFNETNNIHTVNDRDEIKETKHFSMFELGNLSLGDLSKTLLSKELKIFGHDVYQVDIKTITWMHAMYGLRGAEKETNLNVILKGQFHNLEYHLEIRVGNVIIYSVNKGYNNDFLPNELNELTGFLQKGLIKFIQEKIN